MGLVVTKGEEGFLVAPEERSARETRAALLGMTAFACRRSLHAVGYMVPSLAGLPPRVEARAAPGMRRAEVRVPVAFAMMAIGFRFA